MSKFSELVGTEVRHQERAASGQEPQPSPSVSTSSPPQTSFDGERRWQTNGDYFWNANLTLEALPAALYRCVNVSNIGYALERLKIDTDDLLELPDSPSAAVLEEVRQFWGLKPEFAKRGFIHKRGVLLWGPPGSGKTATLQQLISIVIKKHRGIGVFIDAPAFAFACLQMARRIEPRRPIVAMLEDLDALVEKHGENEFLALLDGEAQVSNIVFVATTNYPERLDRRFVDRPSRFDLIKQIGMPTPEARRSYLTTKEPSLSAAELDDWVARSEGFSIAHLRELIVLCRCYGQPLGAAVSRLEEMREGSPNSGQADDGRRRVLGFRGTK
jgi:ATPase family associated with various cellular activities (AAA)